MKTLTIQNIVVPIDFSKMSMQAIQIARRLARRFGASTHLAHVRQFNYPADFVTPGPLPSHFPLCQSRTRNKPCSRTSRKWLLNAVSHPQAATFSQAHRPSMKSVVLRRQFLPISL
jgi:nucleotide-binding universal stress UspA family protein